MARLESAAFEAEAYLDAAAAATGLAVPDECREGVARNLERTRAFALLLLDFEGAAGLDPAPVFRILPETA